jgi:hypothetical protein
MKHSEALNFLEELKKDIKASRLGPYIQIYLEGLIDCIIQYLSQVYILLPAVIEDE